MANVFVLGQRFDFATFDEIDSTPTGGAMDEVGTRTTLQSIANSRATLGMFGSGFIEMLARQMTEELQAIRDSTGLGESSVLTTAGVNFGRITRRQDGTWDVSEVDGLPAASLETTDTTPPSLLLRPFHQAGRVVSLREFSNNAFNHHHGIQATERFGAGVDADGDGFDNELTRADITAVSLFQATMATPGRVIPNDPEVEDAVLVGEVKFQEIGCAVCHVPSLRLEAGGRIFVEPNPYNPSGNLRPGDAPPMSVDLTSDEWPGPRLKPDEAGVVRVPAFTDLKLHDITSGPDDPNREPLDMQHAGGSEGFFAGNGKFLTRKLWDIGNKPNHYHHGKYTTIRESILAHAGEALDSRRNFESLTARERDCVVEFLKTLQVLPPGTKDLIVDETGAPKIWPPNRVTQIVKAGPNEVSIFWQGGTGLGVTPRIYQLQRCNDLGGRIWEDLAEPTAETTITTTTSGGSEFYRVLLLVE